jgi:hypothetical protein
VYENCDIIAKSLDFEKKLPVETFTKSIFLKESAEIHSVLKKKTS